MQTVTVAENYKSKNYEKKNFKLDINKDKQEFYEGLKVGSILGLYARSRYPGWQCYIKSAKIVVFYISLSDELEENEHII